MKRFIALLAALLIVLGTLTTGVASAKSDFVIKNGVLTKYTGMGGHIVIPEGVTEIAEYVFQFKPVTSLKLPSTLKIIGRHAFSLLDGSMSTVTIPASVTKIGEGAFRGNGGGSLKEINVEAGNKHFKSINGVLFSKNGKELLCYPSGKRDIFYKIPSKVQVIKAYSFGNSALQTVEIPSSVKTIEDYAFYVSRRLKELTIPSTVKSFSLHAVQACSALKKLVIRSCKTKVTALFYDLDNVPKLKIYAPADHPVKKLAKQMGIKFKAIKDEALIITGIKLNKTKATLKKGATLTVKIKAITPKTAAGQEVKWTTSDKKVATVDKNGKVTAKKKGTCVITCASKDDSTVKAEIKITVK